MTREEGSEYFCVHFPIYAFMSHRCLTVLFACFQVSVHEIQDTYFECVGGGVLRNLIIA